MEATRSGAEAAQRPTSSREAGGWASLPACPAPHLAHADRHGQWPQLLVEGHQHAGLHGRHQPVQHVVGLAQDD